MTRFRLLLVASLLGAAVAGTPPTQVAASTTSRSTLPTYTWSDKPSPVVLLLQRRRTLRPHTYCWRGPSSPTPSGGEIGPAVTCADSLPQSPRQLHQVARTAPIRFWFGRPGWRWRARISSFTQPRRLGCTVRRTPERLAPRRFLLQAPTHRGTYRVSLFGRGPEGDVFVEFSWRYGATRGRCS